MLFNCDRATKVHRRAHHLDQRGECSHNQPNNYICAHAQKLYFLLVHYTSLSSGNENKMETNHLMDLRRSCYHGHDPDCQKSHSGCLKGKLFFLQFLCSCGSDWCNGVILLICSSFLCSCGSDWSQVEKRLIDLLAPSQVKRSLNRSVT